MVIVLVLPVIIYTVNHQSFLIRACASMNSLFFWFDFLKASDEIGVVVYGRLVILMLILMFRSR